MRKSMDRRSLLALFNLRGRASPAGTLAARWREPAPDAVYRAAREIRGRIDAALAASRADTPIDGPHG
jgi:hypothetical protein